MTEFHKEIIGVLAAILTTSAFIPQAYKIYRYKVSDGVSLLMYTIMLIGVLTWLIYGILINSFAIIFANTITLILQLIIIYFRIRYRKRS